MQYSKTLVRMLAHAMLEEVRREAWKNVVNREDAMHLVEVELHGIRETQKAFYEETKPRFALAYCQSLTLEEIKEWIEQQVKMKEDAGR